jgi:hypothetical protein
MRPGGRVFTLRDVFADGMFAEAGAYSFSDADDLLVKYARLFNLPTVLEDSRGLTSIFFIKGKRIKLTPGGSREWPGDLTAEERQVGLDPLWNKLVKSVFPEIGDAAASDWPPSSLKKYDQLSLCHADRPADDRSADEVKSRPILANGWRHLSRARRPDFIGSFAMRIDSHTSPRSHLRSQGGTESAPRSTLAG